MLLIDFENLKEFLEIILYFFNKDYILEIIFLKIVVLEFILNEFFLHFADNTLKIAIKILLNFAKVFKGGYMDYCLS
jgi:hypothetical protein